ncbi:MAG: SMI1/KNR4 family protein [Cyanobacteria bacterium P01_F01_bin.86]
MPDNTYRHLGEGETCHRFSASVAVGNKVKIPRVDLLLEEKDDGQLWQGVLLDAPMEQIYMQFKVILHLEDGREGVANIFRVDPGKAYFTGQGSLKDPKELTPIPPPINIRDKITDVPESLEQLLPLLIGFDGNAAATTEQIQAVEEALAVRFPSALRELYLNYDGFQCEEFYTFPLGTPSDIDDESLFARNGELRTYNDEDESGQLIPSEIVHFLIKDWIVFGENCIQEFLLMNAHDGTVATWLMEDSPIYQPYAGSLKEFLWWQNSL